MCCVCVTTVPIEKLADPSNLERFYREARAVAALRAEKAEAGPRPLDDRIQALVRHFADPSVGLRAIVAIHSTALGPAATRPLTRQSPASGRYADRSSATCMATVTSNRSSSSGRSS